MSDALMAPPNYVIRPNQSIICRVSQPLLLPSSLPSSSTTTITSTPSSDNSLFSLLHLLLELTLSSVLTAFHQPPSTPEHHCLPTHKPRSRISPCILPRESDRISSLQEVHAQATILVHGRLLLPQVCLPVYATETHALLLQTRSSNRTHRPQPPRNICFFLQSSHHNTP